MKRRRLGAFSTSPPLLRASLVCGLAAGCTATGGTATCQSPFEQILADSSGQLLLRAAQEHTPTPTELAMAAGSWAIAIHAVQTGTIDPTLAKWDIPSSFAAVPAEYPSLYTCAGGAGATTASDNRGASSFAIISAPHDCCDDCVPGPDQVQGLYGNFVSTVGDVSIGALQQPLQDILGGLKGGYDLNLSYKDAAASIPPGDVQAMQAALFEYLKNIAGLTGTALSALEFGEVAAVIAQPLLLISGAALAGQLVQLVELQGLQTNCLTYLEACCSGYFSGARSGQDRCTNKLYGCESATCLPHTSDCAQAAAGSWVADAIYPDVVLGVCAGGGTEVLQFTISDCVAEEGGPVPVSYTWQAQSESGQSMSGSGAFQATFDPDACVVSLTGVYPGCTGSTPVMINLRDRTCSNVNAYCPQDCTMGDPAMCSLQQQ